MTTWLQLTGPPSGYAWCPDTPSLYGADFDLKILAAADNWAAGTTQTIVSQWETSNNQQAYRMDSSTAGSMRMGITPDGITESANSAGAVGTAPALVNGEPMWTRWIRVSATGAFTKQRSSDGVNWTNIATGTVGVGLVLFDSSAVHIIGGRDAIPPGGPSTPFTGRMFAAELSFDGIVRSSPDFRQLSPGARGFIDRQGNVWSVNGAAAITGSSPAALVV